jgi:hypothetical protein
MLQTRRGGRWQIALVLGAIGLAGITVIGQGATPAVPSGAAYVVRDLLDSRTLREAHPEILDTPVLPGSVMKAVTLVAALESGSLKPGDTHLCRRVVTVAGSKYVCTHPDLRRPLTPAEALAHSCNDFFLSLASRLSRDAVNAARRGVGLPPLAAATPLAPALIGLDGPRVTPRALVGVLARLAGAGLEAAMPLRQHNRPLLEYGLSV